MMQGFSAAVILFGQHATSPLIPDYAIYMMVFIHLAILLGALCGLAGAAFCFAGKRISWPLLMSSALFFIYLHIYYASNMDFRSSQDAALSIYAVMLLGLMIMLFRSAKTIFAVRIKDVAVALVLVAFIIFIHAEAYHNAIFWALHFN